MGYMCQVFLIDYRCILINLQYLALVPILLMTECYPPPKYR